jgi:hypothetical protein
VTPQTKHQSAQNQTQKRQPMPSVPQAIQQQLKGQQPQPALGNITPEQMMLLNKMQQLMGNNQPQ